MLIILLCLLLCSCAKNHNDNEYFIHVVGFEEADGDLKASAVCEKQSGEKEDFFLIEQAGKNPDEIAKKIRKKYKNCYFATTEMYFFKDGLSDKRLSSLAKHLTESNVFPTKSLGISVSGNEYKKKLDGIKNEEDLKKLLDEHEDKGKNIINLFRDITKGKGNEN